ncbi:nitrogen permease regulator 2-domain-containing protein [Thelephora terrestris]|uniref:Nitrogen permease regulator 2-domain-containing protein n=1 Tax=Thelephora terrestris TaxID=56493 RepID=A0A9P6HPA4_9AGAM|nr:nitrogen permease regulator 2-domain-containing protein [Thelephora terrestris]
MADGDSFLPRIQSVFYAVFDNDQGPKIVYQVPEGLIAVPTDLSSSQHLQPPPTANTGSSSPRKRPSATNTVLFQFDEISKYVIPQSPLCGRLVTCPTRDHRVLGFPVELLGNYSRNYLRYNVCFVFNRSADLSCYEPAVRKVSRVLTACEEESRFLSNPETSKNILAILEQLYEDLNSYSETSILIDDSNSIQLKIHPFFPNPPQVHDWQVPLTLINLKKRIEPNWDLTMVKVCNVIDGVSHVSRLAALADCDLELTRQAIAHLLHYQVIMMTDIFQFSNMYTLRRSIRWLADERHVYDECGPYVTLPGRKVPDWPKLLHLYSRLKPGKTVLEWMQEYEIERLGIDVRRFTSFGVIKGFLRRVHRWPVLLSDTVPSHVSVERRSSSSAVRGRAESFSASLFPVPPQQSIDQLTPPRYANRGRPPDRPEPFSPGRSQPHSIVQDMTVAGQRKQSAAENALESLRDQHQRRRADSAATTKGYSVKDELAFSRKTSEKGPERGSENSSIRQPPQNLRSMLSKLSQGLPGSRPPDPPAPPSSPVMVAHPIPLNTKSSNSPSTPVQQSQRTSKASFGSGGTGLGIDSGVGLVSTLVVPSELPQLLNGEHHTDELATKFEAGWPMLQKWLFAIGGGSEEGDFGRIVMVYR